MPQSPHRLRNDLKCVEWISHSVVLVVSVFLAYHFVSRVNRPNLYPKTAFGEHLQHTPIKWRASSANCATQQTERFEDAKKSVSLLHFHTPAGIISLILPSTSLRQVAESWYRVGSNRVTCFNHDRGSWRNSAH